MTRFPASSAPTTARRAMYVPTERRFFGDHRLQGSYPSGNMINKTQIMRWCGQFKRKGAAVAPAPCWTGAGRDLCT